MIRLNPNDSINTQAPHTEIPDTTLVRKTFYKPKPSFKIAKSKDTISLKDFGHDYIPYKNSYTKGLNSFDFFASFKEAHIKKINYSVFKTTDSTITYSVSKEEFNIKPLTNNVNIGGINDLIFILLLGCFALLAYLRFAYSKYIQQMAESLYNYQIVLRLIRNKNTLFERIALMFNGLYLFSFAIFVSQVIKYYNISIPGISEKQMLLLVFAAVLLIIIYRHISNFFIGTVFHKQEAIKEYVFNLFLYYKVLGFILLPIGLLVTFLPHEYKAFFMFLGFAIILIEFLMRMFRGMKIILSKDVLVFYMILYFCIIEFLPLALLVKISLSSL